MSLVNGKKLSENIKEAQAEQYCDPTEYYESLKLRMSRKITDYFTINKNLIYENFYDFMDYLEFTQIFSKDELEVIWKTFTIIAEDREALELQDAIKGVNELLGYYYSDSDNKNNDQDIHENNKNNDQDKYRTDDNYQLKYFDPELKCNIINNDDLINYNTYNGNGDDNDKNNSPYLVENKKCDSISKNNTMDLINKDLNTSNNFIISDEINTNTRDGNSLDNKTYHSGANSINNPKKPIHERKITKIFKEIDVETLKQLRKVFSLLDIRNKQYLHIGELQDILKYKFINLTYDRILEFLQYLSYDLDAATGNVLLNKNLNYSNSAFDIQRNGKISINFELYSRAVSAIEQKIFIENIEEFHETLNQSHEVKENFEELLDDLDSLEGESRDYICVIAEIFITLRQKYEADSIEIDNYISLLTNNLHKNLEGICEKNNFHDNTVSIDNSNNIDETNLFYLKVFNDLFSSFDDLKSHLIEYFKSLKNKYEDLEIFLKDLNTNSNHINSKVGLLRLISEKYEENTKSLEEDYKTLYERYNSTLPVEINDELELLMEENAYLKDELESKVNIIEASKKDQREKDDKIINMDFEISKMQRNYSDLQAELYQYKRSHEDLQKDYSKLRNEIYEKILAEEENSKNSKSPDDSIGSSSICESFFLKQKFLKEESESANKILRMSYEKLVLYCLDVEKRSGKLTSLFAKQENKIKALQQEIEDLKNQIHQFNKQIYLLNNENVRLNTKLNDMLKENEFNKAFRPSIALNNRLSRMSTTISKRTGMIRPSLKISNTCNNYNKNDNRGSINNIYNYSSSFENIKNKTYGFFAFDKNRIQSVLHQNESLNIEEIDKLNLINNKSIAKEYENSVENNNLNYESNILRKRIEFSKTMQAQEESTPKPIIDSNHYSSIKNSIFEFSKGDRKDNQALDEKDELRLSCLEFDKEFDLQDQINLVNANQNLRRVLNNSLDDLNYDNSNEVELTNYDSELVKEREQINSAGLFAVRPLFSIIKNSDGVEIDNNADDTNKLCQNKRISNLENNPFEYDDEIGLRMKVKSGYSLENYTNSFYDKTIENMNINNISINIENNEKKSMNIEAFNANVHFDNISQESQTPVLAIDEDYININNKTNSISKNDYIRITESNDHAADPDHKTTNPTLFEINSPQGIYSNHEKIDLGNIYDSNNKVTTRSSIKINNYLQNNPEEINDINHTEINCSSFKKSSAAYEKNKCQNPIYYFDHNTQNVLIASDKNINSDIKLRSSRNLCKKNDDLLNQQQIENLDITYKYDCKINKKILPSSNISKNNNNEKAPTNSINPVNNSKENGGAKRNKHNGNYTNKDSIKKDNYNNNKFSMNKNREIIEEDIEEEENEKKDKLNSTDKAPIGRTSDKIKQLGHTRSDTLDLDKEFNKPSEYVCYDFLSLRKNVAIINMLDKYLESVSSYEMFSENVHYFDDQKKKSKRILFVTSNAIYILRPNDTSEKLRLPIRELTKITISNKNCNLIVFHFANSDDIMLEILRRIELLYYFRDLYKIKSLGKLRLRYSDNFKIQQGGILKSITIDQSNKLFITPNFENAQKLAYIEKLCGGFFQRFKDKLVVLSNIGLMYFNDPKEPPRQLIPIVGSKIVTVDEKKYRKKNCFEIKTLNNEVFVFAVKTKEDLDSWLKEFDAFKVSYRKMMKCVEEKKLGNKYNCTRDNVVDSASDNNNNNNKNSTKSFNNKNRKI